MLKTLEKLGRKQEMAWNEMGDSATLFGQFDIFSWSDNDLL